MSDYVLSSELRGFEKRFNRIVSVTHHDSLTVFDDFLTFVIGMFNPEPNPDMVWRYKNEHNVLFFELMREWLDVQKRQIDIRGWYDTFGDFFMACVGRTSQQYRGQFFTPQGVCDLMANVTMGNTTDEKPMTTCGVFGKRRIVNDCACGSARLLLAAHAVNIKNGQRTSYFVAEDIDRMCCKMAAINLCVHGCFGEVVCHDSLAEPGNVNVGYIINEGLYPIPTMPTIRVCEDARCFVSAQIRFAKAERPQKENIKKEPVQLTLF